VSSTLAVFFLFVFDKSCYIGWYTRLIRLVLVRMNGFISTWLHTHFHLCLHTGSTELSLIYTFRFFSTTNLPQLPPTENSLKLNEISPINPQSDTREKHHLLLLLTSCVAVWRHCGDAEVTWPLPTLAQSKRLHLSPSNENMFTSMLCSNVHGATRHGENTASSIVAQSREHVYRGIA
jgi:hypothetical protein